jgi:hypothetical protein
MRCLFLLTLCGCGYFGSYAQNSIVFHTMMKTGVVYRQTMQSETNIVLNYDSMGQEMKNALQNNPVMENMLKKQRMLVEAEARCGQPDAGTGIMPVRMKVTRDTGIISQALPVGTTFFGHVSPGKLPVFDSTDMAGGEQAQSMLAAMKNIGLQVSLPDTTMSVGQSYTQVTPIDLPTGAGMNLKMIMTQTYTLRDFSADTAGFDIKVTGVMDMSGGEVPVSGRAAGEGHLTYDRKNNYPTDSQLSLIMVMGISQGVYTVRMEVRSSQLSHCVISKE